MAAPTDAKRKKTKNKQSHLHSKYKKKERVHSDFTNMSRVFQKCKTLLTELAVILHSREIIAGVEDKVAVVSESRAESIQRSPERC